MEIFFYLFFNMISATAFEIAANTVNILLLLMKNISWLKHEKNGFLIFAMSIQFA